MTSTYQNQSISFTDLNGNTASLFPDLGLVITTPTQTLTTNVNGFTNGTNTLLFTDLYAGVQKTRAISYLNSTTTKLQVNNTIEMTDGITTNTLTQSDWTGTIKSVNTTANLTYYLTFSDSSTTGQGNPQKTAGLSVNPSTNTITATTFNGNATSASTCVGINLTSDNTAGTYYIPFSKSTSATGNALFIDNTTTPLTFNPFTGAITSTSFIGSLSGTSTTATAVTTTSDNTAGTYYLPFIKTTAGTSTPLYVDDTTGPLSYNPSTSTLTALTFVGALSGNATSATTSTTATTATAVTTTSDNSNTLCYIPFIKTTAGASTPLYVDDTTGPLTYNPNTSTITITSLTTTNISATNLTTSIASTQTGINFSSFAMAATGTITLTTSQFYTYVYGTPTAGQTVILPTATVNGTWISITNLGSGGGRDMTIQYPSGTTIDTVPQGSATAGNAMKFVWITALSRWMVAG
jgi:hypothetical protein